MFGSQSYAAICQANLMQVTFRDNPLRDRDNYAKKRFSFNFACQLSNLFFSFFFLMKKIAKRSF